MRMTLAHIVAALIYFGLPIVAVMFLLSWLTGCAQREVVWYKAGATEQEFMRNRYECARDAIVAGPTTYVGFGYTERNADPRVFIACMNAHGYVASVR